MFRAVKRVGPFLSLVLIAYPQSVSEHDGRVLFT
jgi:hypothetical protein